MLWRYLRGWYMFVRVYHKARTKRHGAGPAARLYAYRLAQCMRYLVDGQHRGARGPWFARSWAEHERRLRPE